MKNSELITNENKSKRNNKLYCGICNKKLPIFNIKCKCNKLYCSIHRYPSDHNCTYNFQEEGKRKLNDLLENQKIKVRKIDLI